MSSAVSVMYCGQVSRMHLQSALLGPAHLLHRLAPGDVHDHDRNADHSAWLMARCVASRSTACGRDTAW